MWAFYFCFESCGWLVWLFEIVDQVFDRMPVRAILSWNSVTGCSLLLVLVVMVLVHAFFVNGTHSSLHDRTHRTHSSPPDQTQKPFLKPIFSHFKIEDSREGIKLPFGPDLSSMGQASIQVLFWVKDFVGLVLLSQVCHKFIIDWGKTSSQFNSKWVSYQSKSCYQDIEIYNLTYCLGVLYRLQKLGPISQLYASYIDCRSSFPFFFERSLRD